jgi:uncharacterized protein DUF4837
MKRLVLFAAVSGVVIASASCDTKGIGYGDQNSIIAVMSNDLWDEVSEDVYGALETTIRTVRDEKMFTVTYQDPMGENWADLRRFKQILLVGPASDIRVAEALEEAPEPITSPGVYQIEEVWSRDQVVTLVLLPEGGGADDLSLHLGSIHEMLDEQYRVWVSNRMYFSGVDSALADTLYTEAGFQLLLPNVYDRAERDSMYIFRNDEPDPSELIRQIAVTWRTPVPAEMEPEGLIAWREEVAEAHYSEPQLTVTDNSEAGPFEFRGWFAYQIQAEWRNRPEGGWPAAGPLITRAVICEGQNRMYLLDAWLYAPAKEKYEYVIQLETILDTFRCGTA